MSARTTTKGFTIIEVVLVLAIAGLIFLMVFVALPALQSGQRDQARRSDVGTVSSAVSTYGTNNRGTFPNTTQLAGTSDGAPGTDGKFGGYLEAVSTNTTSVVVRSAAISSDTNITVNEGDIVVTKQSRCKAAGTTGADSVYTVTKGTSRQYSVITWLEAGGGSAFCQDS